MLSEDRSNAQIISTAGAVPVKTEQGKVIMQKVKVNRYVTGKRPDYAPDSSSEESDDEEFIIKQTKQQQPVLAVDDDIAEEIQDRRLRRLHDLRKERDEEAEEEEDSDDDRVARHRRNVIEPEVLAEGTDSEDERLRRREEDESSEEEEELDEEEIERRRNLLRQRALQRKEEEEVLGVEEEKSEGESEDESSEYEEYSDSEEETGPRLKPVFVRKKDRITIQEKERNEVKMKELEHESKKLTEDRRKQTLKMVEEDHRRELELRRDVKDACDAIDSGGDDEEEYEGWKVRELRRLKRDREEKDNEERARVELERVHGMTEEERRAEFQRNPKERTNKAPKGKYKFLQKYYHRGAFYMDNEEGVLKQDFSNPTLEDHFDKTILPKVMQVKNFGRSGRTKYTHLVDQDTTQFDSPWMADTAQNIKFQNAKGGGMKQDFDRPTTKKTR